MGRVLLFSLLSWSAVAPAQIPVLHVSPVRLVVVVDAQTLPAPQQVRIRNTGSGSLRWKATPAVPWLRVSPPAGSGPAVLTVEIDRARLAPGRHEGRFTVDAGDADDSPVSVTVTVEVAAPSASDASKRSAAPSRAAAAEAGPPAAAQPPTKPDSPSDRDEAAGAKPDSGTALGGLRVERQTLRPATRNLPYAQAIPIAGGTAPYAIRIVEGRLPAGLVLSQGSISGTARVQGYYPFVIAVTDASKPPVTISQLLGLRVIILQADTALVVSPPSMNLRLPGRGHDARAKLEIASGRQRLEWTIGSDVPWIRVVPPSGVSPAAVEIIASADRLPPGTHLGTLTVTMEGAPNSPATIPVQVTVPR
jgi:hypothetical protein